MGDITSVQQFRAASPRLGSPDVGTSTPVLHTGTQIATRLFQHGRCGSVIAAGTYQGCKFSPAFSGSPHVVVTGVGLDGSIHSVTIENLASGSMKLRCNVGGTKSAYWQAWQA